MYILSLITISILNINMVATNTTDSISYNIKNDNITNTSNEKDSISYTIASWYGPKYHGKITANGEIFNQEELTCASNILKFGTIIAVTNLKNNKSIIVIVNDRGPFKMDRKGNALKPLISHPSRGLDLSKAAFSKIADLNSGIIKVSYKILK